MRLTIRILTVVTGAIGAAAPGHSAVAAALDAKAVLVVAKTFNFLIKKPAPDAKVIIVGGAADPAATQAALGKMAVSAGAPGDAAGAFAVIVDTPDAAKAAKAANPTVMTIGSEVGCVDSGACVLAVETQPKVTIYVSRAAAQAAGIEFDPNFKMLITEK